MTTNNRQEGTNLHISASQNGNSSKREKQTRVISGTTIDNEAGKGAMRSPLEREGNDIITKNKIDREKYQHSNQDK